MKSWLLFFPLSFLLAVTAAAQEAGVTNLWIFSFNERGTEASPALAPDGTLYEGTLRGWLYALTPDGKLKWKFKAGLEIKSSAAVAADGTVYFGSRDRHCYALAPDGKLKWKFATGAWVDSSPAIASDGAIYFGSWDTNFYALNPDGQLKWKFSTGGIINSSPAISADGTVYFGSHDKNFYALTPDGKLKWKFSTGAEITASPAIAADGSIYLSSTDGNFYALNADGTEHWRLHTGGYTAASPVLDEAGNIYFGANNELYSLSPDGKVRWHFSRQNKNYASALALADDQIFIAAPWSDSGAISDADAKFLWSFPVGYGFFSSANVSPAGVIYIADEMRVYAWLPLKKVGEEMRMAGAVPAKSSWPMWRANPQHTGRVAK